jgi:RNA polymerase sigma factor (sigma-70 family)
MVLMIAQWPRSTGVAIMRFEELIDTHHDEIFRYLWRWALTGGGADPESDAHDLTQETFLRAYRAYDRLKPQSNARAWLYRIATNCAHSAWRKSRCQPQVSAFEEDDPWISDAASPEQQTIAGHEAASVRRALSHLPVKQRTAVTLRHLQGLDYEAIASALDCSVESARANVHLGLGKLRQALVSPEEA